MPDIWPWRHWALPSCGYVFRFFVSVSYFVHPIEIPNTIEIILDLSITVLFYWCRNQVNFDLKFRICVAIFFSISLWTLSETFVHFQNSYTYSVMSEKVPQDRKKHNFIQIFRFSQIFDEHSLLMLYKKHIAKMECKKS